MKRTITCKNENGLELSFGSSFNPFMLEDCEGIYDVIIDVKHNDNTGMDGATYQSSREEKRNIVLTLRDHPQQDHRANRDLLYALFRKGQPGTLTYRETPEDEPKVITYYPESVLPGGKGNARQMTVSLLCPDPHWTAPGDTTVIISGWKPVLTFPHTFSDAGEPFGVRLATKLAAVQNDSAAENTGMEITIRASGEVTNPAIHHVEQGLFLKIGTADMPYVMQHEGELVITTGDNEKHIYEVVDGVRTEINEYMDDDSEFIQLTPGLNTIGYSADEGERYMSVTLKYRKRYTGV